MERVHDDEIDRSSLGAMGWYNLAFANLEAADHLIASKAKLSFDEPIRALYAHAWELALKACLRKQGFAPSQIRKKFGHRLDIIWSVVDRDRFYQLRLHDELDGFINHLTFYHSNRLYSYPLAGIRRELGLDYLRATSSRLRVPRALAIERIEDSHSKTRG